MVTHIGSLDKWRNVKSAIRSAGNRKGCDIGYAPAISSCEEANSVDTCTVAALDAITAFAVPNPQLLLAEPVGFFGSGCPSGRPVQQITQPTSGRQVLFRQSFQPSTSAKLNSCFIAVNAILGNNILGTMRIGVLGWNPTVTGSAASYFFRNYHLHKPTPNDRRQIGPEFIAKKC